MRFITNFAGMIRAFAIAGLLCTSYSFAAQEPTMNQIYATAQGGNLDQAQVMVQQVLVSHPSSAKAHFVQSELFARQGNMAKAQEALNQAEKLAPGLPFAKAEAVQALKSQISAHNANLQAAKSTNATSYSNPSAHSSGSWLVPALLAGGVITAAYFIFRRKTPQPFEQPAAYGNGLNGPQTFGSPAMQPAYGAPNYGQPGYGQTTGSGLGGKIMGGVATGLAVGAGVVAAEAIGRSLMGNHDAAPRAADNYSNNFEPIAGNSDMGGQNFGVTDTSWDDAGAVDSGSNDWDN